MNSADDIFLENSTKPLYDDEVSKFLQKRMVYVNSTSTEYPSNQGELSTSVLTNSALWCGYGSDDCVIQMPIVMTMYPNHCAVQRDTTDVYELDWKDIDAATCFSLGQSHELISSLSIQYNNTEIETRIPSHAKLITYKLITDSTRATRESERREQGRAIFHAKVHANLHFCSFVRLLYLLSEEGSQASEQPSRHRIRTE